VFYSRGRGVSVLRFKRVFLLIKYELNDSYARSKRHMARAINKYWSKWIKKEQKRDKYNE
jgi:hypothetical protein